MKKILAVAPHPDDETLGCGATLLKRKERGAELHWVIATDMAGAGYTAAARRERDKTIARVAKEYGFASVTRLGFATTRLDAVPMADVVAKLGAAVKKIAPDEIFGPHRGDVHTDHRVVFDAVAACAKWFRYPSARRVLAYETLSETGMGLGDADAFAPDHFEAIEGQLERKLEILSLFPGELGAFPFPRSVEAVRALAAVRGATAGFKAAEAFMVLKERA